MSVNLEQEAKDKVFALIDERIKELFEEGILKVKLTEHRYAYDDNSDYTIDIVMNDKVIHTEESDSKFHGF